MDRSVAFDDLSWYESSLLKLSIYVAGEDEGAIRNPKAYLPEDVKRGSGIGLSVKS